MCLGPSAKRNLHRVCNTNIGCDSRTRTYDFPINSRAFYQLNYTAILAERAGIEPTISESKSDVLPIRLSLYDFFSLAESEGFEPSSCCKATNWLATNRNKPLCQLSLNGAENRSRTYI